MSTWQQVSATATDKDIERLVEAHMRDGLDEPGAELSERDRAVIALAVEATIVYATRRALCRIKDAIFA